MINIIAEIGINHNGDIEICKKLMMLAKVAGCDFAKLQKELLIYAFLKVRNLYPKRLHGVK